MGTFFTDDSDFADPTDLPTKKQKAYYGALFAMAAADETVEREEMELIFETLDLENLDEEDTRDVHGYVIEPPALENCLRHLEDAEEAIRYGLMLNLIEVMIADDLEEATEKAYVESAQERLGITQEQVDEMKNFAREVKRIRERGLDDKQAADALKRAASSLSGVGVPMAAIAYSGSVVGLSAAGITSGLAALGLGLGMLPGIGVAIALGTAIYIGMNSLFDTGQKRKKERLQKERQRKAQLAIQNLQETIGTLLERLANLQESAADAEANKEAVKKLNDRLRKLKRVLSRREEQMEGA
jgi:uncharacterized protein YlxW (UPF0749 family)